MGKCKFHPDRETPYQCMKHNYFLCEECLACNDPDLYCKFRSSCAIHFLSRKGFKTAQPAEPQKEPVTS